MPHEVGRQFRHEGCGAARIGFFKAQFACEPRRSAAGFARPRGPQVARLVPHARFARSALACKAACVNVAAPVQQDFAPARRQIIALRPTDGAQTSERPWAESP